MERRILIRGRMIQKRIKPSKRKGCHRFANNQDFGRTLKGTPPGHRVRVAG